MKESNANKLRKNYWKMGVKQKEPLKLPQLTELPQIEMVVSGIQYEKYGRPGTAIPGSKLRRGYCPLCKEPIRMVIQRKVLTDGIEEIDLSENAYFKDCSICKGSHSSKGNQHPATPLSETSFRGGLAPGEW